VTAGGTAAGTLAAKDVGTQAVTITGVTVTGTGNGNYTATQQTGLSQAVTQKALTAQGTLSGGGKIYDGFTTATPTGAAALLSAEAAGGSTADGKPYTGDTVSLTGTAAYNFNSKDVATATTITESGLSLTGAQATDYSLTAPDLERVHHQGDGDGGGDALQCDLRWCGTHGDGDVDHGSERRG